MTDNEIIKALECCLICADVFVCETQCPFYKKCKSNEELVDYVIAIINRQKAEIERLNGCVKSEEEVREIMKSQMMPMVKEIVNEQFDVAVKLARAEAIKEFAERLKKVYDNYTIFGRGVAKGEIDYLVKEMVGDDNADD